MKRFTLVTGNNGKLREWKRLLPADYDIDSVDVDIDEIQSNDMEVIIADKARRAYQHVKSPVAVEDIAAGLERLAGLPGPFIKFFELKLGMDALFQLAKNENEPAIVKCAMAYYDGNNLISVHSEVRGTVVSARGENGFGFDKCFVPAGQNKTYGEMTPKEKDAVSHRSLAIKKLLKALGD